MPLSFAAITPHSPILVPTIGKDNSSRLSKTINSYRKIGESLSLTKTETLIIISPHGKKEGKKIGLNAAPDLNINFEEFGDFSSKTKVKTDLRTTELIRSAFLEDGRLKALNQPKLDFGSGVPIFTLLTEKKNIEIVSINSSRLSAKDHFEIGTALGQALEGVKKNLAVIASADLSHRLEKRSPAGFSPKGQKFDLRILDLIHEKRIEDLLALDENLISEAKPCGLKTILMLFGILYGAGADWEMTSSTYEAPFGVGYLTASLGIK
jgi:MEMO1 family protein